MRNIILMAVALVLLAGCNASVTAPTSTPNPPQPQNGDDVQSAPSTVITGVDMMLLLLAGTTIAITVIAFSLGWTAHSWYAKSKAQTQPTSLIILTPDEYQHMLNELHEVHDEQVRHE
jgi:hypothetical protein